MVEREQIGNNILEVDSEFADGYAKGMGRAVYAL